MSALLEMPGGARFLELSRRDMASGKYRQKQHERYQRDDSFHVKEPPVSKLGLKAQPFRKYSTNYSNGLLIFPFPARERFAAGLKLMLQIWRQVDKSQINSKLKSD